MIYLNPNQEKHLIRYMINEPDLFMASGASRAVFSCTTDIADYLHLPEKDHGRYVMKVALGKGGISQMKTEFETYTEYGDRGVLAEIVAIGRYVEIMEAVDVWDFRDEADWGYEVSAEEIYSNNEDYLTEEDAQKVVDTICLLNDLFGCTSDNGQIGKNSRGMWVAFDYGYIPENGHDSQTSDISDYIEDDDYRDKYMLGLLELLDQEEDFMGAWEKTFLGEDDEDEEDEEEDDYSEEKDTAYWERDTYEEEKDSSFTD